MSFRLAEFQPITHNLLCNRLFGAYVTNLEVPRPIGSLETQYTRDFSTFTCLLNVQTR